MTECLAHVRLCSVLEFDEEDSQVRFDEAARCLILIKHRTFEALPVNRALPPIAADSRGKVEAVRFSLNLQFAALQRSDRQIDFVHFTSGKTFPLLCKGGGSRGRWRILSFYWTGTPVADFAVVTTAGVEFYLVIPGKAGLRLVKTIALSVAWANYSHMTRLIVLATGTQARTQSPPPPPLTPRPGPRILPCRGRRAALRSCASPRPEPPCRSGSSADAAPSASVRPSVPRCILRPGQRGARNPDSAGLTRAHSQV